MKTKKRLILFCRTVMVVMAVLLISSCQKPDKVQEFGDIFDVSGVMSLNEKIDNSNTVSDLAELLPESGLNVPENMSIEKLEEMYTFLEQNIKLSDDETDKLLRNDPNTLVQVITRFGNLPAEFGNKDMNFEELSKSSFSKYLLVQKEEPGINYYPDDYYSAVQAYRGYIEKCIIKPMKKLHTVVLHNQNQLPHGAQFQYYVLIAMNNNWAMWWSYWRFGNIIFKIKHKGGAGSFPG